MPPRQRPAAVEASPVTAYIDAADEPARSRLRELREVIRGEAPEAVERIAYGLATWHLGENLIHLGAFKNHVGVYPGAAAMVAFADELTAYETSKGAIQLPHGAPVPTDLVRRITRWRVAHIVEAGIWRPAGLAAVDPPAVTSWRRRARSAPR